MARTPEDRDDRLAVTVRVDAAELSERLAAMVDAALARDRHAVRYAAPRSQLLYGPAAVDWEWPALATELDGGEAAEPPLRPWRTVAAPAGRRADPARVPVLARGGRREVVIDGE